jgi:hypothetical protein
VSDEQNRISREEEFWTAPRLFAAWFVFLGVCVVIIYAMATFAFSNLSG